MFFLTIFYFLTRLPFLRTYPVYYDSFEYAQIAEKINFFNFSQIISFSHQPIHTFYFLTILFFKKIFFFLPTNMVLVLISLIFGYLATLIWYLFVKRYLGSKQKALFVSFLILIFPYFFRANTNILYESELLFLQIVSLYFFLWGLKENQFFKIILAGIFWGFSISLFTGSLIIFPVFLLFYPPLKRTLSRSASWRMKRLKVSLGGLSPFSLFLLILLSLLVPLLIDLLILKHPEPLLTKYQLHLGDLVSPQGGSWIFLFRILRNIAIQGAAVLSLPAFALLALSLISLIIPQIPLLSRFSPSTHLPLLTLTSWLLPPLVLMQFWHSGLYGRLGLFLVFPASLFLAENLTKNWQRNLVLLVLLVPLVPQLLSQKQTPPIYRFYSLIENGPKDEIAIITSDSNRFLYQKNNLTTLVVGPGTTLEVVEKFISNNKKLGKMTLIDSQAILSPYFQFDGDSYHLLSKNKKDQPYLKSLKEKISTEVFLSDPKHPKIYFLKIK